MSDAQVHEIVTSLLLPGLIIFTAVVAYVFGVRPVLKKNPAFAVIYSTEDTALNALAAKLNGAKQKLVTIFVSAAGFIVVAHDSIGSLLQLAGIDPVAYGSQILPKVPTMAWPIITLAVIWLIQYFRSLADKQARANAEALLNSGQPLAAPAPGLPINTLPSPSPLPNKKDA
jgi:hypothetical protein